MGTRIPYHRHSTQPTEAERRRRYQRERADQDRQAFYRSKAWREVRERVLDASPLCALCMAQGRITAARVVDHLQEVKDAPALALEPSNLQSLCVPCHNRKTASRPDATVIVTRGIPGSGKTTWAKEIVQKDPRYVRVSRDDIRREMRVLNGECEDRVRECRDRAILAALEAGHRVIVDECAIQEGTYQRIRTLALPAITGAKWFDVPLDVCLARNAMREGLERVPDEVLIRYHAEYQAAHGR